MVLLAALSSIELLDASQQPFVVPDQFALLQVPSDGLCFWYSLWLAVAATPQQVHAWFIEPRNATGMPCPAAHKKAENEVMLWALDLCRVTGCTMPTGGRKRITDRVCAEMDDIDPKLMHCTGSILYTLAVLLQSLSIVYKLL